MQQRECSECGALSAATEARFCPACGTPFHGPPAGAQARVAPAVAADRPWLAGQITAAAGALLVAVGTLMPWAQAGLLSANGIQKAELDAYILIAFGVVATFSIVLDIARGRRTRPLSLAIAGIITGGISTHDYISLKRQLDALNAESPFLVSVGPGIYLCIGASIAILVGAALIAGAPGKR